MMKKCATPDQDPALGNGQNRFLPNASLLLECIYLYIKKSLIYLPLIPLVLLVSILPPNFYTHCRFLRR
jgi:hypothetical protein